MGSCLRMISGDFDSLINELRLRNLYHLVDVFNLQGFQPSSAPSESWERVLRHNWHLRNLAMVLYLFVALACSRKCCQLCR